MYVTKKEVDDDNDQSIEYEYLI